MIYGYARVSTKDQNLEQQIYELRKLGIEDKNIYREKISTRKRVLPERDSLISILVSGDKLVTLSLDRLARSVEELIRLVNLLHSKGVDFQTIKTSIDTSTPQGRMFFYLTAMFAEMERDLIRERVLAGIQEAKRQGRVGGRPPKIGPQQIELARELKANGQSVSSIARGLGVKSNTLWVRMKTG